MKRLLKYNSFASISFEYYRKFESKRKWSGFLHLINGGNAFHISHGRNQESIYLQAIKILKKLEKKG